MKKLLSFILCAALCCAAVAQNQGHSNDSSSKTEKNPVKVKIEKITQDEFVKKIYNYKDTTAVYKGKTPLIVDCYADWCGPCKRLSPILEELNEEYAGKIRIVKLNTDENKQLARDLNISSIPTMFFFIHNEKPMRVRGLLQKVQLKEIIDNYMLDAKKDR